MRKLTTILLSLLMAFTLCLSVSAEDNNDDDLSTQATSVAKVDDTEYATLQEAINNANGKEVVLFASTNEDIIIPENVTVTININEGVTLTNKTDHTIINKGNLTITGSGTVDNVTHARGTLKNEVGATAVLKGCSFLRSQEAGSSSTSDGDNSWYNIYNQGTLDIYDGTVVKQNGVYSSLINNQGKTPEKAFLTIYGGYFEGGKYTVKNDESGFLNIKDGTFANKAEGTVLNWNICEISGGYFIQSGSRYTIVNLRYGSYDAAKGILTISDGEFEGEIFTNSFITGGIECQSENVEISGGIFLSDVSKYLLEGYNVAKIGEKFIVVKDGDKAPVTEKVTGAIDETVYQKVTSDAGEGITSIVLKSEEKALNDEEKVKVDQKVKEDIDLKDKDVEYLPLDLTLIAYKGSEVYPITELTQNIRIALYLDDDTLSKIEGKTVKIVRIHNGESTLLDAELEGNALIFETDRFSNYVIAYGSTVSTPTTSDTNKSYDPKDKNHDGIISCDEEMNSSNWVWSENKKACVYKVTNTSAR